MREQCLGENTNREDGGMEEHHPENSILTGALRAFPLGLRIMNFFMVLILIYFYGPDPDIFWNFFGVFRGIKVP